jgi:hypothetical protein
MAIEAIPGGAIFGAVGLGGNCCTTIATISINVPIRNAPSMNAVLRPIRLESRNYEEVWLVEISERGSEREHKPRKRW